MPTLKEIRQRMGWAEDQAVNFVETAGGLVPDGLPEDTSSLLYHVRKLKEEIEPHIGEDTSLGDDSTDDGGSGSGAAWYEPPSVGNASVIWDYRAGGNRDLQAISSATEAENQLFDGAGLHPNPPEAWEYSDDFDGSGTGALVAKWVDWGGDPGDQARQFMIHVGEHGDVAASRATDVVIRFKIWPGRRANDGVGWGVLESFDAFNENDSVSPNAARKFMRWIGEAWDGSLAKGTGLLAGPEPGSLTISAKPPSETWNIGAFNNSVDRSDWENQLIEIAIRLKCESSPGAEDGMLGIWARIPSLGEQERLALGEIGCEYIRRFTTPTVMRSPQQDQSEYWYDMVVWEGPS